MSKNKGKNRDEEPNPLIVANRDILQRLNFLYQASVLLHGLAPLGPARVDNHEDTPGSSMTLNDKDTEGDQSRLTKSTSQRKKRRRIVRLEELSRSYVDTMKSVGQKTMVRMDPSVKRRLCKRCSAPLIPGISASVRVQDSASHGHLVAYTCHCCQTERRIPAPPVLRVGSPADEEVMDVQRPRGSGRRRRKRGPQPRLPPLFARDGGHVVLRGNERLDGTHSIS